MKAFIRPAKRAALLFSTCAVLTFFANAQTTISSLKFMGEYDVPHNLQYNNTTVGGLSGIDYDAPKKVYYIISDDRSAINPARFYTAKIDIGNKGIDSVYFVDVAQLRQENGEVYPNSKKDPAHTPDPEAIRYNPLTKDLVWSSEGERIVNANGNNVLEDPAITIIDEKGMYKDSFPLPQQLHMHATENGPRQNSVFEGLTFADDYKTLYVSVEEPLYDDGPPAGLSDVATWIRILKYDATTKKLLAQYAYHPDPVPYAPIPATGLMMNGIPDILALDHSHLLVMERSYSSGRFQCTIKIYLADISKASDIAHVQSLKQQPPSNIITKKLLINLASTGRFIDNMEGMTFGPTLPNGHKTLVLVADNNFSRLERNQFFLFEVVP